MTETKQLPALPAATTGAETAAAEKLILNGDMFALNAPERISYYNGFCQRLGLDPVTRPFQLLKLNGKLVMYLDRNGAEQLANKHEISMEIKESKIVEDCYVVRVEAYTYLRKRTTESTGAVTIGGLKGEALCNALMKAETKAKRRAILSICGMGLIDESEIETIKGAERVNIDDVTEKPAPKKLTTAPGAKTTKTSPAAHADALIADAKASTAEPSAFNAGTTTSGTMPEQEIEDADIFNVEQTGQPGQEAWVSIEQAGVKKGWDSEVLETWVIDKLKKDGILTKDPESEEDIYSKWNWKFVNECLEFVASNAQPAG